MRENVEVELCAMVDENGALYSPHRMLNIGQKRAEG